MRTSLRKSIHPLFCILLASVVGRPSILVGAAGIAATAPMDRSSSTSSVAAPSSPASPQRRQSPPNDAGSPPPGVRRRITAWSGSRKINVFEDDEEASDGGCSASAPTRTSDDRRAATAEGTTTTPAAADVARRNFLSSLVAGVGSGSLASVVCAPLDLVRTRIQVAGGLEGGGPAAKVRVVQSLREIYRSDGVRGCFRGLGATLATVPAFWGIYFPLYEGLKRRLHERTTVVDGDGGHHQHALVHLTSAIAAGAIADVVCNPMFVVRTRMQTEALHYSRMPPSERMPRGVVRTVAGMYREGGLPIFWRGLTASLLGLGHVGIQFPVYERLKAEARRRSPTGEESPMDLLLASGLSKMTAAVATYPHEVIRSRMMDARGAAAGKDVFSTFRHVVRNEGYGGLYAGLRISLIRVVPNCCVTFVSYELIARWVRAQMGEKRGGADDE